MHQSRRIHHCFAGVRLVAGFLVVGLVFGLGCSKVSRSARYLEKANRYFDAGRLDKAEIEYLNALRLQPQNPLAIRRLGNIYYDQGRLRTSFQFLTRAKQLAPDDLDSRVKLAAVVVALGQREKMKEELNAILALNPTHPVAVLLLAEAAVSPLEVVETQETLQRLRQKAGDQPIYHVAEGMLFLRQTNSVSAEQAFNRAKVMDSRIATTYLGLGAISWQRNDLVSAEQFFKLAAGLSPARSIRQLPFVDFQIKTGRAKEAQIYLEEFVKKTPDFIPALNRLAELQFSAGKTNECLANITRALALDPENYEASALRGRLKLSQRRAVEAIQEFERLKTLYPKQGLVHYQLGRAYLMNRDVGKAVGSLEEAVSLNPNLYEAEILLVDLRIRQGDASEAIRLLSNIIKRRPKDQDALYLLANAHQVQGATDDALQVYRQLAREFPNNPLSSLLMGGILRQQNKLTESRKAFETALRIAPESTAAISQLVELDLLEKKISEALLRAEAAVQKNPKSLELQFALAKTLMIKGDAVQAEAALRKCIEIAPNYREPYISLAQLFIRTRKPDLAMQEANRLLARNPKDTGTLLMLGMLQEAKGDYTSSKDTYEKLLAVDPKFGLALNNLAYVYSVRLGQPAKGLPLARRARELLPDDPAVSDTLGWATYLTGDYTGALTLLQESSGKLVGVSEAQYHVGMAYYMTGRENAARAALQQAVAGDETYPGKDEAREKLAILGGATSMPIPELIQSLEKAQAKNPNDVAVLLRLGALYEQSGQLDKAQGVGEKALKVNPKAVRAMLLLARVHGARPGGAQRALDYAKSARAVAPEDLEVAYAAGRAAFHAGQHEWAYSILQEGNRKHPGNPEVAFDFAWSAYSVGRVAEAEKAMENVVRQGTNTANVDAAKLFLDMVALARNPAGMPQATTKIQAALKVDPTYVPALMAAALAWEQSKGYVEAGKRYEQVLTRFPQFLPAIRNLAILYANHLDNVQKGYELAAKARQSLAEDMELARALGKLAYRRNDYQYAARLLKDVQQKNAADAESYFYLGLSQAQLKQPTEGAASLRQALALNLDAKLATEANRVLTELK